MTRAMWLAILCIILQSVIVGLAIVAFVRVRRARAELKARREQR